MQSKKCLSHTDLNKNFFFFQLLKSKVLSENRGVQFLIHLFSSVITENCWNCCRRKKTFAIMFERLKVKIYSGTKLSEAKTLAFLIFFIFILNTPIVFSIASLTSSCTSKDNDGGSLYAQNKTP